MKDTNLQRQGQKALQSLVNKPLVKSLIPKSLVGAAFVAALDQGVEAALKRSSIARPVNALQPLVKSLIPKSLVGAAFVAALDQGVEAALDQGVLAALNQGVEAALDQGVLAALMDLRRGSHKGCPYCAPICAPGYVPENAYLSC
jgi:hypothetical protein